MEQSSLPRGITMPCAFWPFKFDRLPPSIYLLNVVGCLYLKDLKTHSTRAFIIDLMFKMTGHLNFVIIKEKSYSFVYKT